MKLSKKLLAITALAAAFAAPAQAQDKSVKFVLDFVPLGRHAPWYVALAKGYFKDEKLDVSILPSKGTADAIRMVESGIAELGLVDVPSLVASGSAGANIRMVAVNYQKPPYCVFSLNPGANVSSPKDMVSLEIGSSTSSFVPQIFRAFMQMNGQDGSSLKVVNIDGAARVPMLAARKVAAIDTFLMSEPSIRRAVTGAQPKCLFLGDYGLDIYSNGIGVKDSYLKANPDVVKGFVRAALRGWQYALNNPEEAARLQIQYIKALDPQVAAEEIQILRRVAITPDVEKDGYGVVSLDKMRRTVKFINDNVAVTGTPLTAEGIYAPGYLPNSPIRP